MKSENAISKDKNILLVLSQKETATRELMYLMKNFCGMVVHHFSEIQEHRLKKIYVCGDISKLESAATPIYIGVIRELSYNYENCDKTHVQIVGLGKVPVLVSDAGVYFRHLFEDDADYFNKIKAEHAFQDLTESTKPGVAFRKGIYLTEVSKTVSEEQTEILHYRLLRCSSNLSGATDNFRETDRFVMKAINEAAQSVFEQETSINHVLAQIYENKKKSDTQPKDTKAKIKAHSDKTKDMPQEALIAFCTFYDKSSFQHLKPSKSDRYDWCYKDISGLTRLYFKLKSSVKDAHLDKEFSVLLYPNSVFFIPLSTNRLYTHEIKPSILNVEQIPTRLGYVARCSKTEALYMNYKTYIQENGAFVPMEEMTEKSRLDLKNTYKEENQTENRIQYGKVFFSMNAGDYQKPIL